MTKLESIFLLEKAGLNTPEFHGVLEGNASGKKFFPERVSIRTEKERDFKSPHFPNVRYDDVKQDIRELLKKGYSVYVFGAINPRECIRKGNVMLSHDGSSFTFEWKDGPGTVRDLEKLVPETREYPGGIGVPEDLRLPYSAMRTLGPAGMGMILEWSIYPYPVGRLKAYDIYWELRPWK